MQDTIAKSKRGVQDSNIKYVKDKTNRTPIRNVSKGNSPNKSAKSKSPT
jgi:hypothetical protein